ncbi:pilus assembly protein PilP [Thalassolituus sp. LLYu03]|uniref:pilus assembly protein PilP n=1 Tax=Thalassolituus sp. LLYu03 TaxID=3421656 RepID=UPI003D2E5F15
MKRFVCLCLLAGSLLGCGGDSDVSDLKKFVDTTLNRPRGRIEPIPVFKPYEYFNYSAAGLRSPFELPIIEDTQVEVQQGADIHPDMDRPKEHLEQYALGSLAMVGTLTRADGVLWALVRDGDGSVVRVKEGQYMGQNFGRIISIGDYKINLIEIVPNGMGGWIERPRTVALEGLGGE